MQLKLRASEIHLGSHSDFTISKLHPGPKMRFSGALKSVHPISGDSDAGTPREIPYQTQLVKPFPAPFVQEITPCLEGWGGVWTGHRIGVASTIEGSKPHSGQGYLPSLFHPPPVPLSAPHTFNLDIYSKLWILSRVEFCPSSLFGLQIEVALHIPS